MKKLVIFLLILFICFGCVTTKIPQKVLIERSGYYTLQEKEKDYSYPKILNWTK
jgi:hypothetical protein